MNGVVIIDKPSGKTSHDVVAEIRKVLGIKKVGHTGTLDPLATGVLPVCINEATKMVPFFENHSKDYRATMLLESKRILWIQKARSSIGRIPRCNLAILKGYLRSLWEK